MGEQIFSVALNGFAAGILPGVDQVNIHVVGLPGKAGLKGYADALRRRNQHIKNGGGEKDAAAGSYGAEDRGQGRIGAEKYISAQPAVSHHGLEVVCAQLVSADKDIGSGGNILRRKNRPGGKRIALMDNGIDGTGQQRIHLIYGVVNVDVGNHGVQLIAAQTVNELIGDQTLRINLYQRVLTGEILNVVLRPDKLGHMAKADAQGVLDPFAAFQLANRRVPQL